MSPQNNTGYFPYGGRMTDQEFFKYRVKGRPYPRDDERRRRVKKALIDFGVETVSALAKEINVCQPVLSEVINGTRRSPKLERRIAEFLNLPCEYLFPSRSMLELAEMNKRAQEKQGAA